MDWKYKHFHQEKTFAASRDVVVDAARRYVSESLGWKVTDTADGLRAEGYGFSHAAVANLRIQSLGSETRIAVDLMVERAGPMGFMLFDVGGYYTIQIRKWLEGIQLAIHQARSGTLEQSPIPIPNQNKTGARLFNGCMMITFAILGLWFFGNFISAIIGLATGTLYLWGKGGTLVLHGMTARIVAALVVAFGAFLAWQVTRTRRRRA
jgi:hypothetical protein